MLLFNQMVKYNLDSIFSCLSDSTRRNILEYLTTGEKNVHEIARPYDMSLPAISKHLTVLEKAGLIQRHREGRQIKVRLTPQGLQQAMSYMAFYRKYWNQQFDNLEKFLRKEDSSIGRSNINRKKSV